MPNVVIPLILYVMSLSSPWLSDIVLYQHDQVCVIKSSPIIIQLTQPSNPTEHEYHMTMCSKNDIFISC